MATPTSSAQKEMPQKIVIIEGATGQNLFTSSEMRILPRVGETFKIGGKEYTVNRVEHSITDDLRNHLILLHVD